MLKKIKKIRRHLCIIFSIIKLYPQVVIANFTQQFWNQRLYYLFIKHFTWAFTHSSFIRVKRSARFSLKQIKYATIKKDRLSLNGGDDNTSSLPHWCIHNTVFGARCHTYEPKEKFFKLPYLPTVKTKKKKPF